MQDDIFLIIRADDFGMCHAVNRAIADAFSGGRITTASVMVPCPWFEEAAALCRRHPRWDVGVHLTLFSEWENYRWGPVLPPSRVSSLVAEDGRFFRSPKELFRRRPSPAEIEREFRAQIERARARGLRLTHLDFHMARTPPLLRIARRLACEFHLPISLDNGENAIRRTFLPSLRSGSAVQKAARALKFLRPGTNIFYCHPGYSHPELAAIRQRHKKPGFLARQRQASFDALAPHALRFLKRGLAVRLIGYREFSLLFPSRRKTSPR
ncbi:MAG TPA: polysaccharide deacetylase family protein [Elusimicrobiota bacterium]|nr:polysaccharide deacetylase family protein [Elusimicrobiota bacterium]